eukprot:gene28756-31938_t
MASATWMGKGCCTLLGSMQPMYNRSNKEMRLMPTHEKVSNITCVTVSPNKKYLAMVEETHDSDVQQVSVYSLASDKVVKQLILDANMTDSRFIEYVSFRYVSKLQPGKQPGIRHSG